MAVIFFSYWKLNKCNFGKFTFNWLSNHFISLHNSIFINYTFHLKVFKLLMHYFFIRIKWNSHTASWINAIFSIIKKKTLHSIESNEWMNDCCKLLIDRLPSVFWRTSYWFQNKTTQLPLDYHLHVKCLACQLRLTVVGSFKETLMPARKRCSLDCNSPLLHSTLISHSCSPHFSLSLSH